MKVNYLVCMAIGCLSVMTFMVHALPVSSTELGKHPRDEPPKKHMTMTEGKDQDGQNMQMAADSSVQGRQEKEQNMQMAADSSGYGRLDKEPEKIKLRMFPKILGTTAPTQVENTWPKRSGVHALRTKQELNFWAKDKTTKSAPKSKDDQLVVGRAGDGAGDGGGKKTPAPNARAGTEMTVSVPRMVTDHMGNWVFNPWGVTFGIVWEDTRFAFDGHHWLPWIMLDYEIEGNYRQDKLHGTVCQGKSTIYNYPKIYNWFPRYIDTSKRNHRNVLLNLRREIYTDGRSESCHIAELDDWYDYQHCAILRNMRMDYLVPNYPLHRWYNT
ncbi:uncharacterized protein LOC121403752 isoform X2 [Drosophila obscura]|uniref:uncharacterized protein LOC121403752 isoform X2 n=1 Tax=Drosophila obscura TaxID=7282 RepID=UPI001BB0E8E1|nr:uncharacterized protein LOC121403752 isoform X2 [Drosophila obscura]